MVFSTASSSGCAFSFAISPGYLSNEAKAWPFKGLRVGRCQPMVLKEELPIRRRATSETVEVPVTLRKQRAVVERIDPDEPRMSLRASVFIVHVGSVARCPGGGGGAGRTSRRCPRPPPQKIPGHSGDDGQDNDEPQPACAPIGCRGCRRGGSGLRESFVHRNERRSRRDLERLEHDGRPFAILTADSGQVMQSAEEARSEGRASSGHLAG